MTLAFFGNIFGLDSVILLVLIMLIFGGKKLPELAKGLTQAVREFRRGKDEDHLQ